MPDLIIKNTEMPDSCLDKCPCCDSDMSRCQASKIDEHVPWGSRPDWCPLRPAPEWISVEDRLPAFDQKVLAWVVNKDPEGRFNGKFGVYVAELKDKEPNPDPKGERNFWGIPGYDSVWTVWAWSYFTEPDVLFWMPLPEPPEGGDNNGE